MQRFKSRHGVAEYNEMCKSPEKDSKSTLLEIIEIIFVTY